ncbi:MAG: Murein tetrapeptide carboxypeptidase [Herbaspirillum frisingense]|uniref:Murein tetrapeptide carboxypeptidase n=1 Tax=Herbaspirillum frisingense TaxID=92645 RepID=A0A7V8G026_9BURK|nr:MAG: Murein tetrapeptide carboxypeptidase [Herbaspirillum frisingense]
MTQAAPAAGRELLDGLVPAGTGVAVVAPCGHAGVDPQRVGRGVALLESLGCRVRNFYDHETRYQRFGATDERRAAQLMEAATDPDIDVILGLRGSYGMSRILPALDIPALASCGKLLVGYSDFTALQFALLKQSGLGGFQGPMLAGDFGAEQPDWQALATMWKTLTSPQTVVRNYTGAAGADRAPNGDRRTDPASPTLCCEGKLWGGNLAMVAHMIGNPWFPQIDGGILYLEDVNEHPFRVERMMLQLEQAGVLARQKAIVLGDFSAYRLVDIDNGYDFGEMLAFLRARIATPIVTGLPFGHVRDLVTLPLGAHAVLEAQGATGFTLTLSDYPTLRRA